MKRIGIVGGISYESTLFYYELFCKKYYERCRDYSYPEIVIVSLNFEKFTDFENNDRTRYIEYIVEGIKSLENAGAAFVIMAANSPHVVFDEVEKRAAVPLLSIVEATAERAHQQGMKTLLLLGIKATMQSSVYQDVCKKYGITVIVPSPNQQDDIEKIIFEELVVGVIREESRTTICDVIMGYDVDGVILGCTELPLLVRQKDVCKELLNTGEIHVEAALDYALE